MYIHLPALIPGVSGLDPSRVCSPSLRYRYLKIYIAHSLNELGNCCLTSASLSHSFTGKRNNDLIDREIAEICKKGICT
jgi:hypothetical protein